MSTPPGACEASPPITFIDVLQDVVDQLFPSVSNLSKAAFGANGRTAMGSGPIDLKIFVHMARGLSPSVPQPHDRGRLTSQALEGRERVNSARLRRFDGNTGAK